MVLYLPSDSTAAAFWTSSSSQAVFKSNLHKVYYSNLDVIRTWLDPVSQGMAITGISVKTARRCFVPETSNHRLGSRSTPTAMNLPFREENFFQDSLTLQTPISYVID